MVRLRGMVPVLILAALMAYPVLAQDTNRFPVGVAGQGKRCYFGECEDSAPPQVPHADGGAPETTAQTPPSTSAPPSTQHGRSHQTAPVAAPTRHVPAPSPYEPPTTTFTAPRLAPNPSTSYPNTTNFGDELTNFFVPPQNVLQTRLGSKTPTSIPGARVVTTVQLRNALQSRVRFLLIDAWDDTQHESIPGAVRIPYAGRPGSFDDNVEKSLFQELSRRTGSNPGYPIVFYCAGSDCWESYNATLRAEAMGYSNVFWYRGGMTAWRQGAIALR
jgi:PQQ-dependent catabolism-associated CXXCW motif protein